MNPVGVSDLYDRVRAAVAERQPVAVATIVRGEPLGAKVLFTDAGVEGSFGDRALDERVAEAARELLERERSETREFERPGAEPVEVFIETFPPSPTLIIFGAVHVAQPLTKIAKMLGYRVIVSDARAKLATEDRFPDADQVIQAWPDETLQGMTIEPNTYVAILTHDPKFDEPALIGALETNARYVGAVGSRKTNRDRRERLRDAGLSEESLSRVRGPIGLDIGADTPEEMAISIMAEIIAARHGRAGGPLTNAIGNIRGEREAATTTA